jgi:hypothetical protein
MSHRHYGKWRNGLNEAQNKQIEFQKQLSYQTTKIFTTMAQLLQNEVEMVASDTDALAELSLTNYRIIYSGKVSKGLFGLWKSGKWHCSIPLENIANLAIISWRHPWLLLLAIILFIAALLLYISNNHPYEGQALVCFIVGLVCLLAYLFGKKQIITIVANSGDSIRVPISADNNADQLINDILEAKNARLNHLLQPKSTTARFCAVP